MHNCFCCIVAIANLVWCVFGNVMAAKLIIVSDDLIYRGPKIDAIGTKNGTVDSHHGPCTMNVEGAVSSVVGIDRIRLVNALQHGIRGVFFGESNMCGSRIRIVIQFFTDICQNMRDNVQRHCFTILCKLHN